MALSGSAARRYAEALIALSPNERAVAELRASLEKLAPVFDRVTVAGLRDPSVPMKERIAALSAALAGEPATVRSLMVLLLETDRIALVPPVTASLVKIGALTEEQLLEFLSSYFRVPAVDLRNLEPDATVVRLLPAEVATKFLAVPLARSGRRLKVALAQPSNLFALDDIKFITGFEVDAVVASEGAIKKTLDRFFDSAGTMADGL